MRPHPWLVVVMVGAAVGLVFAGVSTYDFVQHLDRQVHSLHCSFIPGMDHDGATSGCQVAMMSPYSSVFRARIWGGIPIALPAMSVFAFLGFFAVDLLVTRRKDDARATGFLVAAAALPAAMSIVMLVISLAKLGTTCKLCLAIYVASALCLTGAIGLWRRAVRLRGDEPAPRPRRDPHRRDGSDPAWVGAAREPEASAELEAEVEAPVTTNAFLATAFAIGVAFVAVPVVLYVVLAPDHGRFVGTCEGLIKPDDTYGVMVRVTAGKGDVPALEILDPLCPACRAFEDRLGRASGGDRLDRKAILFPLDNTCNWMVTEATHPGACIVSEAVLCAGDRAPQVIEWAFSVQDRIRAEAKTDPGAAERIVEQRFPELAECVGSPAAKSRLNKSLRWAVSNNIRVLTPQLFVDNVKLCDEDVDIGLDYALRIMLDRHDSHTLVAIPAQGTAPVVPPPTTAKPATDVPATGSATDKPATGSATDKPATGSATDTAATGSATDTPATDEPAAGSAAAGSAADKPPADRPPADKPRKPPVDKPPADKPPTDTPADKPADKPADTPSDTPTDKPADPPPDKPPADKPADKPADTPGGTP